jgi:CRISPR-associated protein Csx10
MIITIQMLSDWHIGSGTGRPGSVDRLIQRDTQGLPYIPAKTLTGILRDGCELVAAGLDESDSGVWHECLEYIFGSQPASPDQEAETKAPLAAALTVRSAHLPLSLQAALHGRTELKSAMTFVKPGVAIDHDNGTAIPNCLRFEEMARGGCTLTAEYALHLNTLEEGTQLAVASLLQAGSAMVERLGAKRRRGAGKCQISWSDLPLDLAQAIKYLEICPPPQWPKPSKIPAVPLQPPQEGIWHSFELQFEAISPIIIHSRTLGNQVNTLDYIPGTCLLPIVAKTLAPLMQDVGSAIGNSQLIITNATVEVSDQRGCPMPFALFQEKQNKERIYNRLRPQPNEDQIPQLKGMRTGYLTKAGDYQSMRTTITIHNTIDDKHQRPNEDGGGVYSYGAIPASTKFRSVIHIQESSLNKSAALEKLQQLQSTTIQIGRSKKDDYGAAKILAVQENTSINSDLRDIASGDELIVWLLSDVLVRNDRLRPSIDPQDFARALGEKLNVKLTLSPVNTASFARSKRTDSWQTRWNLPRPSLVGLSAGSCFLLTTSDPIARATLQQMEISGIGERRAEGYGQICFNSRLLATSNVNLTSKQSILSIYPSNSDSSDYARIIQQAGWRSAIQRQSASLTAQQREELIGIEEKTKERKPSMSQLGNLRSIVMSSSPQTLATDAQIWIKQVSDKVKKNKWLDEMKAVTRLFQEPTQVWQILDIDSELQSLIITGEDVEALKQEFWAEAVRTVVIDSIRTHKRVIEKTTGSGGEYLG